MSCDASDVREAGETGGERLDVASLCRQYQATAKCKYGIIRWSDWKLRGLGCGDRVPGTRCSSAS